MRNTLLRIRAYQSSERLLSQGGKDWGVHGSDALEMAYDNIQAEAVCAVKGVRAVALEEKRSGAKQQAIRSASAIGWNAAQG
jgi:hypothetical protein